jgi:hypothetical protein
MENEPQMMRIPVVSMGHLSPATREDLALVAAQVRTMDGVNIAFDLYGDASAYLVLLDELPEAPDTLAEDVAALRAWALSHDWLWLKLDEDGGAIDTLGYYP